MNEEPPAAATMMEEERQSIARRDEPNSDVGPSRDIATATTTVTESAASAPSAAVTSTTTNRFDNDNNRAKFDHSSRKVVVHNVLKFIRSKDVSKLTSSWINECNNSSNSNIKVQIVNARKPPKDSWIKVTLADDNMVDPFIAFINSGGEDGKALVNERGRPLFAKRVDEMVDYDNNNDAEGDGEDEEAGGTTTSDGQKRKGTCTANGTNTNNVENGNNSSNKRFKSDSPQQILLSDDEVRDAITPLWRLSYDEQLHSKVREMVNKCASKIVKEIKGKFRCVDRRSSIYLDSCIECVSHILLSYRSKYYSDFLKRKPNEGIGRRLSNCTGG